MPKFDRIFTGFEYVIFYHMEIDVLAMLDHVKGGESRFKMWLKRFQVETTDTTNHYVLYIIIYIYVGSAAQPQGTFVFHVGLQKFLALDPILFWG